MTQIIKKSALTAFLVLTLASVLTVPAYARELIVGGQAVGIQISARGAVVAGLSEVETGSGKASPARDAGVRKGDIIIKIQGQEVSKASQVIETVNSLSGAPVSITVLRSGRELNFSIEPAQSGENQWMLGIWLRDGVSGIGTLTFCDPETGIYGALGHSVNDGDSDIPVPVGDGNITDAQIVSITPGLSGQPGELNGCADFGRVIGSIEENADTGIYGHTYVSIDGRYMETGELSAGPASVMSTISGRETGEYSIEINRVCRDSTGVHAMINVTDPELLSRTGGIVQGMSGSPIIQNGCIVGAVTHVFVSDPTRGYAVSINDMLRSAGLCENGRGQDLSSAVLR